MNENAFFKFIAGLGTIWIILIGVLFCSWVVNIFKLLAHITEPITTLEICRIVGIFFAPLGAILGFV